MNRFVVLVAVLCLVWGCGGTLTINGQRRERMFYVASSTTTFLAVYDLDREDHDPGQPEDEIVYDYDLASPAVNLLISPNQLWMFVVTEAGRVERYGIRSNGELSLRPAMVLSAGLANGPMIISPDSKSLYVSADNGRIYQFSLSDTGAPTPMTPAFVSGPPTSSDLATTPDGLALFASDASGNQIWRYTIDANGALTAQSPLPVTGGPAQLGMSPAGGRMVAKCSTSTELALFTVGANAALTEMNRAAAPTGSQDPVVSGNGNFAYISTTNGSKEIWRYSLNPNVTLLTPPRDTNHSEMVGAFLTRLGRFAVMNRTSNSYTEYIIQEDGSLSLQNTVATISQPGLGAFRILP